jgi:hypothetical protein
VLERGNRSYAGTFVFVGPRASEPLIVRDTPMNAETGGLDPQGQAHQALAAAVKDYGPRVLSNPALLSNLFKDLLPGSPREASLLVAAAEAGTASMLEQQVPGIGPDAAVRTIAGDLSQGRALDPQASLWAVGEMAQAMGYPVSPSPQGAPPPSDATLPWAPAVVPLPLPASGMGVSPGAGGYAPPPPPPAPAPPPPGPWGGAAGTPPAPPAPPPSGPGTPVGLPPAWSPPPQPPGQGNRLMALIAVGVVVVVILAYFGIAAAAKLPPFKAAATPSPVASCPSGDHLVGGRCVLPSSRASATPTATPSAGPSSSSSLTPLAHILPSYITGTSTDSCMDEPANAYVASGASDEELCDLTSNDNVPEDYILYVGFPTESPATSYFSSLLSGNGMQVGQGDCSSLSLATATDGSSQYCEDTYTTSSSSGSDFVFSGNPNFDLGSDNPVSNLDACSGASSVDVLGFTDPTYAAVGVAVACSGNEEDSDLNSDFTAGDYFLGS